MSDLLFSTDNGVFSYRVAGICLQNGRVLLQKPENDDGYAFPGGHVAFGETNEQTLIREWKEETGADIEVGPLQWVAEIFFPWDGKPCHQICLYYAVTLLGGSLPAGESFTGGEQFGGRSFSIDFHWLALDQLDRLPLYPPQAARLLLEPDGGVRHFVYREQ